MASRQYTESSIQVLKGLEPVKQRPGMYTLTHNPTHIVQEVVDNASDEALAGFAKRIHVILHRDGSVSVIDDGRGIPVGMHPEEKVPAIELVFCRLHAGGKFDKKDGGAYQFAGGLHGVGVAVTNALSRRLEAEVRRDKSAYRIAFEGGDVAEPLARIGAAPDTGTWVRLWPDPKYFDAPKVPPQDLERLLRSKAVLLPGVEFRLSTERADGTLDSQTWAYRDGMVGYLSEALGEPPVAPYFTGENYIAQDGEFSQGEGAAWAVVWTEEGSVVRESYCNLIPTPAGGAHEAGLRDGAFSAVRNFADAHAMLPKGVKLLPEDVFSRLSFVLSARILDPQFQGQTKEKLNNRDAVKLVSGMVRDPLELWLNDHVDYGRAIAELSIRQAQSRVRSAQRVEKKKTSGVAVLPGKLTDCETDDPRRAELFLVEGDSAGGSAKMGRDKEHQAILPLRGKVLNSFETERDRLFANNEIHDISVALGVDPHGRGDEVDLSRLRYHTVAILADADVDGSHIAVLLLTLFFRHFPRLVEAGHIYIARPPLFRIDVPAHGKNRPLRKLYALDEVELEAIRHKLAKEGVRVENCTVSRFKGLGEMSPEQLFETTMNPDTRRMLRVDVGTGGWESAEAKMTMLMAKQETAARRAWIELHGNEAFADV
jgi:topoisomerase IV subunit B